jgi:hypothetical protein
MSDEPYPDWAFDDMNAALVAAVARAEAAEARVRALEEALRAAKGYLLNIVIDMETGTRRATTAATARGGVNMIDGVLSTPAPVEMPGDVHPNGE